MSSGTACKWNWRSSYSPFWYLIGTLSVSVKRFQVKIASCYQGLGQSQQLTTPFSNAEYIEVGYVLQRHVTGFFIALKRTERPKLHRLVGNPSQKALIWRRNSTKKKTLWLTGLFPASHRFFSSYSAKLACNHTGSWSISTFTALPERSSTL